MGNNEEKNTTPKWREDFPYESEKDDYITRRDFIRYLTVVSGGFAIGTTLFLALDEKIENYPKKQIAKLSDMNNGSWMTFNYPTDDSPVLLIKLKNGELVAFGQKCPHLACPVMYEKETEKDGEFLSCHCHNGKFSAASGEPTQGPPLGLKPLTKIKLLIENDYIYAVGIVELKQLHRS